MLKFYFKKMTAELAEFTPIQCQSYSLHQQHADREPQTNSGCKSNTDFEHPTVRGQFLSEILFLFSNVLKKKKNQQNK